MPTRGQTIDEAIKLFTGAQYPNGQISKEHAWLGIYQVLLWYESVDGWVHFASSYYRRRQVTSFKVQECSSRQQKQVSCGENMADPCQSRRGPHCKPLGHFC